MVEMLMATVIIGTLFVTAYLGLAQSFNVARMTRENVRATQILQDKTETIRLYTWAQISNSIPSSFSAMFYPPGTANNQGILYTGTVSIANSPLTESYSNDLKLVTVTVYWTSGRIACQRQATTLVSHYGLHNYIY